MTSLRIAVAAVAGLALLAAGVGAFMSVQINWAFALTVAGAASYAHIVALSFAAIECTRIVMPMLRRGLMAAELRGVARAAHAAFWMFTVISVTSAFGFFAMNRADATAQRGASVSQTRSYKAELDAITRRIEKAPDLRSVAEVEAELDTLRRTDPRRGQLEIERAAAAQRARDLARLPELRGADTWKVAIVAKDAQLETLADALPWDRDLTLRVGAVLLILAVVVALELLIGFTPFAAIMLLVWACKRPEASAPAVPEPVVTAIAPADHIEKFIAKCTIRGGATQFRPLYEGYLNFCVSRSWQPLSQFHFRPAMQTARGAPIATEKRRDGMFWLDISLRPEWQVGGARAAA